MFAADDACPQAIDSVPVEVALPSDVVVPPPYWAQMNCASAGMTARANAAPSAPALTLVRRLDRCCNGAERAVGFGHDLALAEPIGGDVG